MTKNIFKYAAKNALRFPYKGMASVEDLFDLGLNELDNIYKTLKKQQKNDAGESLIEDKTPQDTQLEVKLAIVKEIFDDKKMALDKSKKAAEKKAQAQKILSIMNRKQDEALQNMSMKELQAQLDGITSEDDIDEE
jgi:lipoate synthase